MLFRHAQAEDFLLAIAQHRHTHRVTTLGTLQCACTVGRIIQFDVINLYRHVTFLQTYLCEQLGITARSQFISNSIPFPILFGVARTRL